MTEQAAKTKKVATITIELDPKANTTETKIDCPNLEPLDVFNILKLMIRQMEKGAAYFPDPLVRAQVEPMAKGMAQMLLGCEQVIAQHKVNEANRIKEMQG